MNKKFTILLTIVLMVSGLNSTIAQTHKKTKKTATPPKPSAATLAQGQAMLAKSDCLSCHRVDIKLVGPAYKDVAAKYAANEDNYNMLVAKIMNGGSGNWGQVAMAAHPSLPAADVRKMVQYILSIKSN
jgi:cytochrome c